MDPRRATDDFPVLTHVSWEDRSWWAGALNRDTVLDYFSHSQFFDRASVNAQLQMQRNQLTPQAVREQLARVPGIVYEIDDNRVEEIPPTAADPAAHSLYAIRKLSRAENGAETTLRYYYVMDGVVYEAPTIAAILQARLKRLGWYLSEAFDAARLAAEPAARSEHTDLNDTASPLQGGTRNKAAAGRAGASSQPPPKRQRGSS